MFVHARAALLRAQKPFPTAEVWDPLVLSSLELRSLGSCGIRELTSEMSQAVGASLLAIFSGPAGQKKLAALVAVLVGVRGWFLLHLCYLRCYLCKYLAQYRLRVVGGTQRGRKLFFLGLSLLVDGIRRCAMRFASF